MRRAAKVDRNQSEIVRALRQAGASVQCLHMVGEGCPDLLVGFGGRNLILEVKDGELPPSKQALTYHEKEWNILWKGQCCVITSVSEALEVLQSV